MKRLIELQTGMKCAIIYGALPMESRTHQARLFNDLTSGYDILVATDAIGMGLNLNIGRIIFYTIKKPTKLPDGSLQVKALPKGAIKQIAGRAGRFQSAYPEGFVTTFQKSDLSFVNQSLKTSGTLLFVTKNLQYFLIFYIFFYRKLDYSRCLIKLNSCRRQSLVFPCTNYSLALKKLPNAMKIISSAIFTHLS